MRATLRCTLTALLFLAVVCAGGRVLAGTAVLSWTPSTNSDVTGYNVYYGTASGDYTVKVPVGDVTSTTLTNLDPNTTYYFSATSVDAAGDESAFSSETIFTTSAPSTVPTAPTLATLTMTSIQTAGVTTAIRITSTGPVPASWTVEASSDLVQWAGVVSGTSATVNVSFMIGGQPQQFFRLVKNN